LIGGRNLDRHRLRRRAIQYSQNCIQWHGIALNDPFAITGCPAVAGHDSRGASFAFVVGTAATGYI
jgi:hypothetical protein